MEYYNIKIPVLCSSIDEARELQERVKNMRVFKFGIVNTVAKSYQNEPNKVVDIISSVSKNPMMAAAKIPEIVSLIKKYS